jgi:hypothetical protein
MTCLPAYDLKSFKTIFFIASLGSFFEGTDCSLFVSIKATFLISFLTEGVVEGDLCSTDASTAVTVVLVDVSDASDSGEILIFLFGDGLSIKRRKKDF